LNGHFVFQRYKRRISRTLSVRRFPAMSTLESRITPMSKCCERLAALDDLFKVSCEVRVHRWFVTKLFGVGFRQSDRLANWTPTYRVGGTHHGYRLGISFDDVEQSEVHRIAEFEGDHARRVENGFAARGPGTDSWRALNRKKAFRLGGDNGEWSYTHILSQGKRKAWYEVSLD
jgi:hypothetical protein